MIRNFIVLVISLLFLPAIAQAEGWDSVTCRSILSGIKTPVFPNREVCITRFGASPVTSARHNQQSINRAISFALSMAAGALLYPRVFTPPAPSRSDRT